MLLRFLAQYDIMFDVNEIIVSTKETKKSIFPLDMSAEDNIPENLQSSERYERAEAAVDALYSAVSSLEEALDYIEEAQGN